MDFVMLEFEYYTSASRHTLRLHSRATEDVPSLAGDDYLYLEPNVGPGAETSLRQTLDAVGELWASYYHPGWSLALANLWAITLGTAIPVPTLPTWGAVAGLLGPIGAVGDPTAQRVFGIISRGLYFRRLWLRQMSTALVIPHKVEVAPSSGGYDARDQGVMSYLSGNVTACLAPDGTPIRPTGEVRTWWDRPYR